MRNKLTIQLKRSLEQKHQVMGQKSLYVFIWGGLHPADKSSAAIDFVKLNSIK